MAEKQNLTVSLDRDVIRRAKILAAQRGASVSQLVAETIRQMVEDDRAYESARREALRFLEEGFHLGGSGVGDRGALHDR